MRCCGLVLVVLVCGCLDTNPLFVDPTEGGVGDTGQAMTTAVQPTTTPDPTTDSASSPSSATTQVDDSAGTTMDAADTESMCGDGIDGPGEECDDGNDIEDDGCHSNCTLPVCGDDVLEFPEECDDGNMIAGDACTDLCTEARCGDGVTQIGVEMCDDGNAIETDDCLESCVPPSCGDGVVQADEQCDDGNSDDSDECDMKCTFAAKLIFVTSAGFSGLLGGLAGADDLCMGFAGEALMPGKFMAWLSDSQQSPDSRMTHAKGPYILPGPDAPMVAANWQDLTDGSLLHAIDRNEFGEMPPQTQESPCGPNGVHSNTEASGMAVSTDSLDSCNDWNSTGGATTLGSTAQTGSKWSNDCYGDVCGMPAPIYCVQQ